MCVCLCAWGYLAGSKAHLRSEQRESEGWDGGRRAFRGRERASSVPRSGRETRNEKNIVRGATAKINSSVFHK